MRPAVQIELLDRFPAEPGEQDGVLFLDRGVEAQRPQGFCVGAGRPDQGRADPEVVTPGVGPDRETAADPPAQILSGNRRGQPDGAEQLARETERQQGEGAVVLVVVILIAIGEHPLLTDEDAAAQVEGPLAVGGRFAPPDGERRCSPRHRPGQHVDVERPHI